MQRRLASSCFRRTSFGAPSLLQVPISLRTGTCRQHGVRPAQAGHDGGIPGGSDRRQSQLGCALGEGRGGEGGLRWPQRRSVAQLAGLPEGR